MLRKKKTVEDDSLAEADVLLPLDTLKEIEGFFPLGNPTIDTTYGMLSLKVNEISEGEKEIIYDGSKNKLSRTVNIHGEYSKEEVIFYTYVILHAKYDSWNPFSSSKSEKADKSNLSDFCHDFFSKAKDYTYKGDRDEFSTKRIFEMFLYCSVQTKEEYDLPPFEEYWRIFEAKDILLPTTYELLFKNEKNSIRKEAVAQKAFAAQKEFTYLRYLLEQLFSRKDYKNFIDLYLSNTDVVTGHGTFPYEAELYFAFVESCIALKDFETLKKNLVDRDAMHLGGRYSKPFFEGVAAYFEGKYADAEVHFKKAILSDDEGRDVTRCATIFYISSLLKQNKNDAAKGFIFDLKPREPYAENYDLDYFDYKKIEINVLTKLQNLDISEEQKNAIKFYEASILYEGSWHYHDKETTSALVKKLNNELLALQNQEQVSDVAMHETMKDVQKLSELVKNVIPYYKFAKPHEKEQIVRVIFSELYVAENTLEYKCKKGFQCFENRFVALCEPSRDGTSWFVVRQGYFNIFLGFKSTLLEHL